MAAAFEVTVTCNTCGYTITFTDTTEAAKSATRPDQCPSCGEPFNFWFSSIAVTHSGNVGANPTTTHTMASRGSISSAVS